MKIKRAFTLEGTPPPREEQRDLRQADMPKREEEIDQLVAPRQLSPTGMIYGLTEEEIRIVEGR